MTSYSITGCDLMGSVLISCFVKQTFLIECTVKNVFEIILAVNKFNVNKYGIRLLLSVLACVCFLTVLPPSRTVN